MIDLHFHPPMMPMSQVHVSEAHVRTSVEGLVTEVTINYFLQEIYIFHINLYNTNSTAY